MANPSDGVSEQPKSTTPAAYLSFATFLGALEALEHGIPKRLDRTIWRSHSGIVQSQIMIAFRFLSLVDDNDQPTPALMRLVEGKERRKEMMAALLRHSYRDLIDHDLTKMTPRMLSEAFDRYNVSGDTKRKAIAFFLRAALFADIHLHPLLTSQMRNAAITGRKRRTTAARVGGASIGAAVGNAIQSHSSANTKAVRLTSGGKVTISISADPFTMPAIDRTFVFGLIDKLNEYEAENPRAQEGDDDE